MSQTTRSPTTRSPTSSSTPRVPSPTLLRHRTRANSPRIPADCVPFTTYVDKDHGPSPSPTARRGFFPTKLNGPSVTYFYKVLLRCTRTFGSSGTPSGFLRALGPWLSLSPSARRCFPDQGERGNPPTWTSLYMVLVLHGFSFPANKSTCKNGTSSIALNVVIKGPLRVSDRRRLPANETHILHAGAPVQTERVP